MERDAYALHKHTAGTIHSQGTVIEAGIKRRRSDSKDDQRSAQPTVSNVRLIIAASFSVLQTSATGSRAKPHEQQDDAGLQESSHLS